MEGSRIATTLNSLSKAIESDPAKGPATYAAATAKVLNGLKCRVTGPAGEQFETDMPASMGGESSSPIPAGFSGRRWPRVARQWSLRVPRSSDLT